MERKPDPVVQEIVTVCARCVIGGIAIFFTLDFLFLLLWLFHHFVTFVGRF